MIQNIRVQRPVGQGFFHTAMVRAARDSTGARISSIPFRYVYDCGAMTKYAVERDREITACHKHLPVDAPIDILFLSHAHADHINGVELLLTGHKALTIMMPLLSHADRLIAFARTVADDPAAATDFYRAFIVDPAAALGGLGPERIIFIEPGDGGAPGSGEGAPLDPSGDPDRGVEGGSIVWKPVGRGQPRPYDGEPYPNGQLPGGGPSIEQMPDSCALMLMVPALPQRWLLAPYVDPGVLADREDFLDELALKLGITRAELDAELLSPAYLEELVTDKLAELKAAYDTLDYNLNLTSLCLYSGPAEDIATRSGSHLFGFGRNRWSRSPQARIAWLATGDAALKESVRRDPFVDHYGEHLSRVVTMTLPHHGSEGNFHIDLLKAIDPAICVAAADRFAKWRHPGSWVVQAVASAGKLLFTTTSAKLSKFCESVWLR